MTRLTVTSSDLAWAAAHLAQDGLVAIPTETVYGLAGRATSGQAVQRIYALKGRPSHNPLIVHVGTAREAEVWGIWNEWAARLAAAFWPGPLTLVLPQTAMAHDTLAAEVTAGLNTVALRVPALEATRALLELCPFPLAAPSANRSGKMSPTSAEHVIAEFGPDLPVLDGGVSDIGVESTIIDLSGPRPILLRPGFITPLSLETILGCTLASYEGHDIKAPGMLASHYAPDLPVRLNVHQPNIDEFFITFGPDVLTGGYKQASLSPTGSLAEAAQRLYATLRMADHSGAKGIAVAPIPNTGIGLAINDRLYRAATR